MSSRGLVETLIRSADSQFLKRLGYVMDPEQESIQPDHDDDDAWHKSLEFKLGEFS